MSRSIVTRHELLDLACAGQPLLLEGSWPENGPSLDEAIDARHAWIDEAAAYWAECLDTLAGYPNGHGQPEVGPAWLNALSLRYYLVKLLRVVAYFTEVQPLKPDESVELAAQWGRDEDYVDLVAQLCDQANVRCHIRWADRPLPAQPALPQNRLWRRASARLGQLIEPPVGSDGSPRVVLCGNPRLLDPVAAALLHRHSRLWWLYDRFALGSWLRWRRQGVGQMTCNSSLGVQHRFGGHKLGRIDCRGIDLARPLERWLAERLAIHGPRQARLLDQIDRHFRRVRPQALVLDEDATPMARAAVAVARQYGATSFVVQHGVPCCRFGFAPLAADRILAWGQSSAEQLLRWGVATEQIRVTGLPQHERLYCRLTGQRRSNNTGASEQKPTRILLLATVPPRDERPDAVIFHLNRKTYAAMLQAAIAAVAAIPDAHLIVKLHPRAPHDPILDRLLADRPALARTIVRSGALEKCLDGIDCVLSCGSSAGVEATLSGVPVIQVLPAGSGDFLPHDCWGMQGTARSEAELRQLLARVLEGDLRPSSAPSPQVFGGLCGSTAERITEAILSELGDSVEPLPGHTPITSHSGEACPVQG